MRDRLVATIDDIPMGMSGLLELYGAVIDATPSGKYPATSPLPRIPGRRDSGRRRMTFRGLFIRRTYCYENSGVFHNVRGSLRSGGHRLCLPEKDWRSTLELVDRTSPYALTVQCRQ